MKWNKLAQDKVWWQVSMSMVLNFVTNWITVHC